MQSCFHAQRNLQRTYAQNFRRARPRCVEAGLYISEPYIFGITIDNVSDTRATHQSAIQLLLALVPWILVYSKNFIVGTWRRMYDIRTYTNIFAEVAGRVAQKQFSSNVETTKIVARSNMARHLVDFF